MPLALPPTVTAEATAFRVAYADGRVLSSPDLIGATPTLPDGLTVRIDAAELDPNAVRGPVWLHTLSVQGEDGGWTNACDPDPDGRRLALPIPGHTRNGLLQPAPNGAFELVCTSGAQGKCVRFGYLPWRGTADRALYNACVRMVRADYSGTGQPTTRPGMRIDIKDDAGIRDWRPNLNFVFEAGWSPSGAVCVHHVRVAAGASLSALAAAYPRLKGRLGEACTEAHARTWGAVVFNRSDPRWHVSFAIRPHL